MRKYGPNPNEIYPNKEVKSVCFIKNIIKNPNIIIGDYTYYSDINGAENFEKQVTHLYDFIGDKLIIGKFCAIAQGVEFIMNGANHQLNSITSYPFFIMGTGWEKVVPKQGSLPFKGDTIVGNDVWIGQNSTIMPGVEIGDGAIIATNSTVVKNVPPYHVVGGNPAKILKRRFDGDLIEHLLEIKWWNWDSEKIFKNLEILCSSNLELIKTIK
ncbi:MAG: Vat family streptogramin A O-acetyltransferase [Fusobacteriaceae bacterium]